MRLKNVVVCGVADTSWNRHSSTDHPLFPRAGTACAAVLGTKVTAAAAIAISAPNRRTTRGCPACSRFQKPFIVLPLVANARRRPPHQGDARPRLIHGRGRGIDPQPPPGPLMHPMVQWPCAGTVPGALHLTPGLV